jgi:ABC-type uncharacterized transport system involved in gliding motility auxiliary subunit
MAAEWMKSRQAKYAGFAGAYGLIVLAVLVVMNILANRYDKSYDSTKNKQFSLSEQTVNIVKGLKQDVTMTYFGEKDSFGRGRDLLDRYSDLSGKLHTKYVDPVKDPQAAKAAGYRPDAPIIIEVGERKEGAKSLSEAEVSTALKRALTTGDRTVCFVSGFGEHSLDESGQEGFSALKQIVEYDNYKTRSVTLKPAAPEGGAALSVKEEAAPAAKVDIPSDCTVLVAGGSQQPYPAPVIDAIKSYMEKGGHAMFTVDNTVQLGKEKPAPDNQGLVDLLAGWGVTANKDVILDGSGIGRLFGFRPIIPIVQSYETSPITRPLGHRMTGYPLVRSLEVKSGSGATVDKLVQTTEDSIAVTEIPPDGKVDVKKAKRGPFTLAVTGQMTGGKGRFIVVGTTQWETNYFTENEQLVNSDLFANAVNWLSSDEELIGIHPKTTEDQSFEITPARLGSMFWMCVVIFPLGVVSFGIATWWKRR